MNVDSYDRFAENVIQVEPSTDDAIYLLSRRVRPYLNALYLAGSLIGFIGFVALSRSDGFDGALVLRVLGMACGVVVLRSAYVIEKQNGGATEKRRCKYCGHYTRYIPPNEGVAYLAGNNCSVCGREYPMPSAFWDNDEGKTYMYERGSVCDPAFYAAFESEHPDHPRSEAADYWLRGDVADVT